jgi:5'-3' exonuclease
MILIDYSQTAISNLMVEIGGKRDVDINVPLIRHMIINSIRSYKQKFGDKYGEMVITCDNIAYWRRDYFPYYKAHRKRDRETSGINWKEIFSALNTIREELDQFFPYKVVNVSGAEADDVIAVLASTHVEPTLIISADHDFVQLQKYKHVQQYNPIQKKMVKLSGSAEDVIFEHVMRGDVGDGVPNILSADDSVFAGERQKPITKKRLSEWKQKLPEDVEFQKNYCRNKTLVDFDMIPEKIKTEILNNFTNQPTKDRSNLLNYFIKNKMKQMMECAQEF